MRKLVSKTYIILALSLLNACNQEVKDEVKVAHLNTNYGDIEFVLLDETPLHKANFIAQVEDSLYSKMLFHRVIENFVIQAGNPLSKGLAEDAPLYDDGDGPIVKKEILPQFHHIRGAVGAAREGDNVNPERNSSYSHFYIVHGLNNDILTDSMINHDGMTPPRFAEEFRKNGGTPHLDGAYTIFGYVVEGMNTVDSIAKVATGSGDRPIKNVVINRVDIKNVKRSKIEDLQIYKFFNE
ncbi:MAG: peptidylprolyl isomerase [Rikenellaceae bacterium]